MVATALDLSQIKTDALSSAATFRSLIELGSTDTPTFKGSTLTGGTVTASTPVIDATQTWNDAAVTFTGMKLDVTDTASASGSLLMDLQVSGTSKFSVDKNSVLNVDKIGEIGLNPSLTKIVFSAPQAWNAITDNNARNTAFSFYTGYPCIRTSSFVVFIGSSLGVHAVNTAFIGFGPSHASSLVDVKLYRDAAGTLAQRNGTNAQEYRLYNTYTDASNYERGFLKWDANVFKIGTEAAGTGVSRSFELASPTTITGGTVTASTPVIDATQTWNDAAVTFTAMKLDVTDTASAAGSKLLDLQVGGTSKFSVEKDSIVRGSKWYSLFQNTGFYSVGFGIAYVMIGDVPVIGFSGRTDIGAISIKNNLALTWAASPTQSGTDLFLWRDAANTLAQRNGTNAQAYNIYNTYTDASNYERAFLKWDSNVFKIGTEAAGTGTARTLTIENVAKINGSTSSAADPSTTEYPNDGDHGIHKNTTSGNVFLAYNDGGSSIVKVQLS